MIFRTNKYGQRYPIFNKPIKLKPKEYGHVCHEIETNGNARQKTENILNYKDVGKFTYIYIYKKENNIAFYGKIKIVGNEEKIKVVQQYIVEVNQRAIW